MPDQADKTEKRSGAIQSVSIAARFLGILANAGGALPLGSLARLAGTSSPTAHRYLHSLVKEGLARQDPYTGHYDLGSTALSIGIAALKRIEPVEIAARHMSDLAQHVAASGGVAIWTDRGPTLVRWYRSAFFSISSLGLGDALPLDNTASGLVFQAFLPPSRVEPARRVQPERFRGATPSPERLAEIRTSCWAELTNHLLPGITGQAAPVFDAQRELVCVMTTVTDLGQIITPDARRALYDKARLANQQTGGIAGFPDVCPV